MKIAIRTLTAATMGFAVSLAVAQAAPVPTDVPGGTYRADPAHTQVVFSVLHMGFTNYTGLFSEGSGTLTFNPAHITSTKLNVSIKIHSVQTTSNHLTEELNSTDWLDAAKYPTATFVSSKVLPTASGAAEIAGILTFHGVSRPATISATFIGAGTNPMNKAYTIGFEGTTKIRRSDFGVSKYVPLVGDDVTLKIAGAFEKQS
ncbi:YceI family protein [Acetobacter fallax]|uniref:Polyisoprenoid-binding protein n=1 Tax=Acetobacter fallax TaxID=1737473 RepID=A0ABX0K9A0_9PROT|nr:YceI family protein [Acetobacter fallax]NHO31125.1 polyisoprenoid-binding protein [Acetobacter fallax]NHO34682.1 polyisoprenoid-binding protein [Acetobacter fallax]